MNRDGYQVEALQTDMDSQDKDAWRQAPKNTPAVVQSDTREDHAKHMKNKMNITELRRRDGDGAEYETPAKQYAAV